MNPAHAAGNRISFEKTGFNPESGNNLWGYYARHFIGHFASIFYYGMIANPGLVKIGLNKPIDPQHEFHD